MILYLKLDFDSWEQNLLPILYEIGVSQVATQLRQLKNVYIVNLNLLTTLYTNELL